MKKQTFGLVSESVFNIVQDGVILLQNIFGCFAALQKVKELQSLYPNDTVIEAVNVSV